METKAFLFTKKHFHKATKKFEDLKHKNWIETYYPFKEIELELPPLNSFAFHTRKWLDPIWDEYVNLCDSLNDEDEWDQWHQGFYEYFGGPDFEFLVKIEEVLKELNAFPKAERNQLLPWNKTTHPPQRRLTAEERAELEASIEQLLESIEHSSPEGSPCPEVSPKLPEDEMGWVYLVKMKDRYKIGRSSQLLIRIKALKPTKIIYEVMCKNYIDLEKEIHSIYDDYRYQGSEIFDLSDKQIKEIQTLMKEKALL